MNKKQTLLAALLLTAIICFKPTDTYKLTEGQAVMIFNHEQALKELLPQSELPAKVATQLMNQADSIQKVIVTQYNTFNADTTKKK